MRSAHRILLALLVTVSCAIPALAQTPTFLENNRICHGKILSDDKPIGEFWIQKEIGARLVYFYSQMGVGSHPFNADTLRAHDYSIDPNGQFAFRTTAGTDYAIDRVLHDGKYTGKGISIHGKYGLEIVCP